MKYILVLSLVVSAAVGQTKTASIAGTVIDAKTQKPVPAVLVMAIKEGVPPFSKYTKTGADGAFQIETLSVGTYSVCVQAGDGYLDPCQWSGTPVKVALEAGQTATGVSVGLVAASVVTIQVQDAQKVLAQRTKDGRQPALMLGVWGPKGLYYPARMTAGPTTGPGAQAGVDRYSYQVGVPRDTELKVYIGSRDLKLGDGAGVALAGNTSQQTFQHASGDTQPKSFVFTVIGLLP